MADDLGDEWWLDHDDSKVKSVGVREDSKEMGLSRDVTSQGNQKPLRTDKKGEFHGKERKQNKRKQDDQLQGDSDQKKTKQKRKKKKKTLTDHLASVADIPGTPDDLQVSMATYFHDKLSAVEMEELILDGDQFLEHNARRESISDYLSRVVPDWSDQARQGKDGKTPNKSCIVLVLTSSARRAVDLNREAGAFKGTCVTAKLFAKHLKVSEQEKFLSTHRVQFAIGTPHRIACLLNTGTFTLDDTVSAILDWNWRDTKLRKFVDIPN